MVLEIESYRKDEDGVLLKGKHSTLSEIQQMVKLIQEIAERDFINLFCNAFDFVRIDDYCGLPDLVLDMDTKFIYKPVIGEIYESI